MKTITHCKTLNLKATVSQLSIHLSYSFDVLLFVSIVITVLMHFNNITIPILFVWNIILFLINDPQTLCKHIFSTVKHHILHVRNCGCLWFEFIMNKTSQLTCNAYFTDNTTSLIKVVHMYKHTCVFLYPSTWKHHFKVKRKTSPLCIKPSPFSLTQTEM